MYSFGVIVQALWSQEKPYTHLAGTEIGPLELMVKVADGFRPQVRDDCPAHFVQLSQRCWDTEPNFRLTAEQAVSFLEKVPQHNSL